MQEKQTSGRKLRIGIIGTGNIGGVHAAAYQAHADRAELAACCDLDEAKMNAFADRFHIPGRYTDMAEMMEKESLDAVSVCTWNSAHKAAAICALQGGADVLCEKPMAMNTAEAAEMAAAAQAAHRLLMVGFVRRFGNDAAAIQPMLERGELGDIYFAKAQYLRRKGYPGGWFGDLAYAGGGPLIDLGVHVIDLVKYLCGNPKPTAAYGMTCRALPAQRRAAGGDWQVKTAQKFAYNCEDSAAAIITFEGGLRLLVETSYSLDIENEINRIELYGTKKGAKFDPALTLCYQSENGEQVNEPAGGDTALSFDGLFEAEIGHFLSCVSEKIPCRATAADGVEMMKILDAVYESAATGREIKI